MNVGREGKTESPLERAGEILARAALQGRKVPAEAEKELRFDAAAQVGAEARFDAARLRLLADAVARSLRPPEPSPASLGQAMLLLSGLPKATLGQDQLLPRIESLLRQADRELSLRTPGRKAVFPP